MIFVSVVASSPLVRAGLEALLREEPRFTIARTAQADVLLIEVASPDQLGKSQRGDVPPAVLLVDHLRRAEILRALQSGARAILPRDAAGPEIMAAIEAVAAGLTVLGSEAIDALLPAPHEDVAAERIRNEPLSARELEVLAMMAEGLGNKDIAARLSISEHTVKFHVSSILGKLGATTRGEAVARGIREGLIAI